MYLVDTNIWLERLLGQEKSEIVGEFLNNVPAENLSISDFDRTPLGRREPADLENIIPID